MDPELTSAVDQARRPDSSRDLDPDLGSGELVGRNVVSIGADLVDIDRMREVISRQPGFVARVFTRSEQDYCNRKPDPAERYAVRFAAKEAVLKVLGTGLGGADFTDIEVVKLGSGKPELRVAGRAAAEAGELGIVDWLITLSHSRDVAQAFVAGLGPGTLTAPSAGLSQPTASQGDRG